MDKKLQFLNNLLVKHGLKAARITLSKESKLADGVAIGTPADDFTVGAEVYIMDADGNPVPAPDGEHTLEDGTVIVVAGGLITEVKAKEEEMSSEVVETLNKLSERITALETERTAQAAELASVKAELESTKTRAITAEAKVTELSKQPAAKSVKEELSKEKEKPAKSLKEKSVKELMSEIREKQSN